MSKEREVSADGVAVDAIETVANFATHVGRRWRSPAALIDLIDNELWWVEEGIRELGERSRAEFAGVPALIARDLRPLRLFEAAMLGHAATNVVNAVWDRRVPEHARYVFSGLSTRATATVREIALLLEHGYAEGAKARWRTLSEILVVARVIALGDRFTATRYKEHRWIMLAEERRKTGVTAWSGDLPSPEVMRRRLLARFGDDFGGTYGWASRITARRLGVTKPTWRHLQDLAGVDEHRSRVHDAHHAVHGADAYGLLGTVEDGSGLFHAGASHEGVLLVSRDTMRLYSQALIAVFHICCRYSTIRKPVIVQGIVEAHLFNLENELSWRILSTDPEAFRRYEEVVSEWFGGLDIN